jgi:hypothetical protein
LLAIPFLAIAAALGGCAHDRSALRLPVPPPPGFTLSEVRRASAAEGLPLTIDYRNRGTVFLSHSTFVMPVGDVNVSVGPPNEVRGAVYVVVMQGHRLVRARNVTVDFAPRASSAQQARAALVRLRRRS